MWETWAESEALTVNLTVGIVMAGVAQDSNRGLGDFIIWETWALEVPNDTT